MSYILQWSESVKFYNSIESLVILFTVCDEWEKFVWLYQPSSAIFIVSSTASIIVLHRFQQSILCGSEAYE